MSPSPRLLGERPARLWGESAQEEAEAVILRVAEGKGLHLLPRPTIPGLSAAPRSCRKLNPPGSRSSKSTRRSGSA
ncbi:hypothetical protein FQA47_009002 [Oryzias melastigma]|uniref:Uncharacterized protein n=1 Tax=Oryzias melastigma TaxID=30732 RepID=A0A834C3A9_ORYME|nr:hypothetical protein FQA47_009002 [Oryzias melastigma]